MSSKTLLCAISFATLISCGSNKESNDTGSQVSAADAQATSNDLLDSANAMIGEFGISDEAKKLVDESISQDPSNKQAYSKKLAILTDAKDYAGLKSALDEMKAQFPEDPYVAMYAAMEEELQSDQVENYDGYVSSFETYIGVMDTLTQASSIIRNGYLGNAALAARLAELNKEDAVERISSALSEEEVGIFTDMLGRFELQSREDILKGRR